MRNSNRELAYTWKTFPVFVRLTTTLWFVIKPPLQIKNLARPSCWRAPNGHFRPEYDRRFGDYADLERIFAARSAFAGHLQLRLISARPRRRGLSSVSSSMGCLWLDRSLYEQWPRLGQYSGGKLTVFNSLFFGWSLPELLSLAPDSFGLPAITGRYSVRL